MAQDVLEPEKKKLKSFVDQARSDGWSDDEIFSFLAGKEGYTKEEVSSFLGKVSPPQKLDVGKPVGITVPINAPISLQRPITPAQKMEADISERDRLEPGVRATRSFSSELGFASERQQRWVKAFVQREAGIDLDQLYKSADKVLADFENLDKGVELPRQFDVKEEALLRGKALPQSGAELALSAATAVGTGTGLVLAPLPTIGFFGLGSVMNADEKFSGYAVPLNRRVRYEDLGIPYDQEPMEDYLVVNNPIDAARLDTYLRLPKERRDELKSIDLQNIPRYSQSFKEGEAKFEPVINPYYDDAYNGSVRKIRSTKSYGEIAASFGEALATLGIKSETPGQAIEAKLGAAGQAPGLSLVADAIIGAGIGKAPSSVKALKKAMVPEVGDVAKAGTLSDRLAEALGDGLIDPEVARTAVEKVANGTNKKVLTNTPAGKVNFSDLRISEAAENQIKPEPTGKPARPIVSIENAPADLHLFEDILGTAPNQLQKFGPAARDGINRITLTEVEYARRVRFGMKQDAKLIKSLPREMRPRFIELIEEAESSGGKINEEKLSQIVSKYPGYNEKVRSALEYHAETMEQYRAALISARRADGIPTPDDWGIQKGYIHHLFRGNLEAVDPDGTFIGRGETNRELLELIEKHQLENPQFAGKQYGVRPTLANREIFAELSKKKQQQIVLALAEESGLSQKQSADLLRSLKLDIPPSAGPLKQRTGAVGYETEDYRKVMGAYRQAIERHLVVGPIKGDIIKKADILAKEGRPQAAARLLFELNRLSGTPSDLSIQFDNAMKRWFGGRVNSRALDRYVGMLSKSVATAYLATPRFGAVNLTQPLGAHGALYGYGNLAKSYWKVIQSAAKPNSEWAQWLREKGVWDAPGKFERFSTGYSKLLEGFRKRWPGSESINNAVAYTDRFDAAKGFGWTTQQAHDYAVLRGMVGTQFFRTQTSQPKFASGLGRAVFMFSPFRVKQGEILMDMVRDHNYPALGKYALSQLTLGGAKLYMTYQMYDAIREKYGKTIADALNYGLPYLAGLDLSRSYDLGLNMRNFSQRNAMDSMQRFLEGWVGPPVGFMAGTVNALLSDGQGTLPVPAYKRVMNFVGNEVPVARSAHRFLLWASGQKEDGELYDLKDAKGNTTYKADGLEIAKEMLGFVGVPRAKAQELVSFQMSQRELFASKHHEAMQYMALGLVESLRGNEKASHEAQERAEGVVNGWNELMFDIAPMDIKQVKESAERAVRKLDSTSIERMIERSPKAMRAYLLEQIQAMELEDQLGVTR